MATLILKATEKCNSNCYYCDVVKRRTGKSMTLELLETVFVRVDEFLKAHPRDRAEILWHGGEPLILGPKYYEAAWELQNKHCRDTQSRIVHNMQTNLTLFSEKYVPVFRKLGIRAVGTSFDPEPHMRGPGKAVDTARYAKMFIKKLAILERNGFGWGMIYVVTKKSLSRPLDIFFFLTNLSLSGGVNFNPVLIYDESRQDVAVTPEEFADFLGAIFPYWWKHQNRYPSIQPFRALTDTIVNGKLSLGCVDSGDCTYNNVNISPDGETSQCGRSADWGLLQYGNIKDRPLGDILRDNQRDHLQLRTETLQIRDCKDCRLWEICHGGCPLDAFSQNEQFMTKSEWCHARKGFIEKYFEPITGTRFEPRNPQRAVGGSAVD